MPVSVLEELTAVIDRVAALDLAQLPAGEVLGLAAGLSASIGRLTGKRLQALSAVEASGVWALDGSRSMPWALARNEETSVGTLRAEITLAQRLDSDLPLTAAALRDGSISVDKARLIARLAPTSEARRIALKDPDTGEAFLLAQAFALDPHRLTQALRFWGYRVDPAHDDDVYREAAEGHYLDLADTLDGTHVHGFVSLEGGELLRTALRAITGVPAANDQRTTGQRNAEALAGLARAFLDAGTHGAGAKVRPHLTVTVPYDTLVASADAVGVDPAMFTETGQPIPRCVLDRIACDAEISRVIFGPDSIVLDAGRTRRIITPDQRRAVIARDEHCRYPGCHAPPRLSEAHHVIPWSRGGVTSVANSILLCWHHHDQVHVRDLTIRRIGEGWIFTEPNGERLR